MIEIKPIDKKETWESFLLNSSNPSFLQSWAWGKFQENLGRKLFRLGLYEKNNLVGISLIYKEQTRLGSYFYCPGGPVLKEFSKKNLEPWPQHITQLAEKESAVFLRIDPRIIGETEKNLIKKAGFVPATQYYQPQCSALIDLSRTQEQLRSAMSSSTRNNVNSAQRKGVVVREGAQEEFDIFLKLLKETASRKALTLPAQENYHKKQFEALNEEGLMRLLIAEVEGKPLSAALVIDYADTAYYLHAANSLEKKELRASYPLVWYAIKQSQQLGAKYFDFWGIAPTDDPKHSWAGVTAFKLSFGAEKICYERPFDLPFSAGYQLMKVFENWRRPVKKLFRFG